MKNEKKNLGLATKKNFFRAHLSSFKTKKPSFCHQGLSGHATKKRTFSAASLRWSAVGLIQDARFCSHFIFGLFEIRSRTLNLSRGQMYTGKYYFPWTIKAFDVSLDFNHRGPLS